MSGAAICWKACPPTNILFTFEGGFLCQWKKGPRCLIIFRTKCTLAPVGRLSADISTDRRSMHRPTVDRQSATVGRRLTDCRYTFGWRVGRWSVAVSTKEAFISCLLTVDRQSVIVSRLSVDMSADCRPTYWPTVGRQSVDSRPMEAKVHLVQSSYPLHRTKYTFPKELTFLSQKGLLFHCALLFLYFRCHKLNVQFWEDHRTAE